MNKIDFIVGVILIICFGYGCYDAGTMAVKEPQNNLVWIDNNRVHKDSIITCKPIYSMNGDQEGEWIKVSYGDNDIFIECLDSEGYTWKEFRDSWLMAFQEATE